MLVWWCMYAGVRMPACQQQIRGACPVLLPHPSAARGVVWLYARAVVWLVPHTSCLPPRKAIWVPGLVFDLFPVIFLIEEAAPAPTFTLNPNLPVRRLAAAQDAAARGRRGRPKRGKNKAGSLKSGPNARTVSEEEAVKSAPSITSMWSPSASIASPSGSTPSPTMNAPSRRISAQSPSAPNSNSVAGRDSASSSRGSSGEAGSGRAHGHGGIGGGGSGNGSSGGSGSAGGSGGRSGGGSARDSIPQLSARHGFIDAIKSKIKASRKHENRRMKWISEFPYTGGWSHPSLPAQKQNGCGRECELVCGKLVITVFIGRFSVCNNTEVIPSPELLQ